MRRVSQLTHRLSRYAHPQGAQDVKIARVVVTVLGWVACGILIFIGWHDMYESIMHEGQGLFPAGLMGIMYILTGLAAGAAGNSIGRLFSLRS